jgi:hypothetical protein
MFDVVEDVLYFVGSALTYSLFLIFQLISSLIWLIFPWDLDFSF